MGSITKVMPCDTEDTHNVTAHRWLNIDDASAMTAAAAAAVYVRKQHERMQKICIGG
jgi:hypothetical protein